MSPRLVLVITILGYAATIGLAVAFPWLGGFIFCPITVFGCWLAVLIAEMHKMRLTIEQMKPAAQLGAQVYNQMQAQKQQPKPAEPEPLPGAGVESTV